MKLDLAAIRKEVLEDAETFEGESVFGAETALQILDRLEAAERVVEACRAWITGGSEHWTEQSYKEITAIEKALDLYDQERGDDAGS